MTLFLLLLHGIVGAALLGAVTHQAIAVRAVGYTRPVVVLYVASLLLGAWIYPAYRLEARVALEEMRLGWAVGLFELKEHFGAIGLAALPLYAACWNESEQPPDLAARRAATWFLAFVAWFDFVVGHVINNLRGL